MRKKKVSVFLVDDDEMYLKSVSHGLGQNKGFAIKTLRSLRLHPKEPSWLSMSASFNSNINDGIALLIIDKIYMVVSLEKVTFNLKFK